MDEKLEEMDKEMGKLMDEKLEEPSSVYLNVEFYFQQFTEQSPAETHDHQKVSRRPSHVRPEKKQVKQVKQELELNS